MPAFGLQIQNFFDPIFGKDMVTPADALLKTETPQ